MAATVMITLTSRKQHSSESTLPATAGIHQASHRSSSFASHSSSIASTRQPLRLASPGQCRKDRQDPSHRQMKLARCGRSSPASIWRALCYQYGPFRCHGIRLPVTTRQRREDWPDPQPLAAKVNLLRPEFADIYLTHEYGPFQGHNISSITVWEAETTSSERQLNGKGGICILSSGAEHTHEKD
jgi:hypothetical protein